MKRIRTFALVALAAASVASAAPAIGPSHFVNYASSDTFLTEAVRAAVPSAPAEGPSRAILMSCAVLGILIVKASRE